MTAARSWRVHKMADLRPGIELSTEDIIFMLDFQSFRPGEQVTRKGKVYTARFTEIRGGRYLRLFDDDGQMWTNSRLEHRHQ